jgi:hypothetical protein
MEDKIMKEIFEVYVETVKDCGYAENVADAVFETLEDAEAFANYKALLDGHSYTVCKRNVNPSGSGKKYTEKMTGKVVRFSGDYNSKEDDPIESILNIYDTEVMCDSIKTPVVEVEQDSTIKSYYMFDITYRLTDKDTSFDAIKTSLVELIKNAILSTK